MTLKSARGHSYRAVELALNQLASHRFALDLMTTRTFGLKELDYAIKSVGGEGALVPSTARCYPGSEELV